MQLNLYLTFDDGPSMESTPRLLDLLAQYDIKASFFVVSRFAEVYPEIIERMQQEGHYIGLHGLTHRSAYLMTPRQMKRQIVEGKDILNKLGVTVTGYRPPWGHRTPWTKRYAKENGLETILWDVMAEDWKANTTAAEIGRKLKDRVSPETIICLHDGRGAEGASERMIDALTIVLPQWIDEGYQFKRVDEQDEDMD